MGIHALHEVIPEHERVVAPQESGDEARPRETWGAYLGKVLVALQSFIVKLWGYACDLAEVAIISLITLWRFICFSVRFTLLAIRRSPWIAVGMVAGWLTFPILVPGTLEPTIRYLQNTDPDQVLEGRTSFASLLGGLVPFKVAEPPGDTSRAHMTSEEIVRALVADHLPRKKPIFSLIGR